MPEELAAIVAELEAPTSLVLGGRTFYQGRYHGHEVVAVVSRIGKVAAAITATVLLERFRVERVLFTGVAGGIAPEVQVGDIVVASELMQHDLDARPLFSRFEVPLLGQARFATDATLRHALTQGAATFAAAPPGDVRTLGLTPRVHVGLVISGDQFVRCSDQTQALAQACPGALAVEMEGAAVAQACFEHQVPFAVVRVISDNANHDAHLDFARFLEVACGAYARGVLARAVAALAPMT